MIVTAADLPQVTELTRTWIESVAPSLSLVWIAPACDQNGEISNELAAAEAVVADCHKNTLILRHVPLIDDLLQHTKEIRFRRTLSLPLDDNALPLVSSEAIVECLHQWIENRNGDRQKIVLTGSSWSGEDLVAEISGVLERNLDSRRYAMRRFEAIDLDRSGEIDAEEMFPYLLELGYGREEALSIIDQADTNQDGTINFQEFIQGLGEHLDKNLADVPAQVHYINVPASAALYDLTSRGMAEASAQSWLDWLTSLQEFGLPVSDASESLAKDTAISEWLEQHVLDFINVYILPGRGVLTIGEGMFEGKPALFTKLLQGDNRLLQGVRTLDNRTVEWQIVGEDTSDVEVVHHQLEKGGSRTLKLKDGQLVGLSVRGLWTGRRWATELFFQHKPLPRWQINLFRELGELQIEETAGMLEPEGVVCNCTQTTCGKLQEMIEGGIDTLEQIADDTSLQAASALLRL